MDKLKHMHTKIPVSKHLSMGPSTNSQRILFILIKYSILLIFVCFSVNLWTYHFKTKWYHEKVSNTASTD